MTIDGLCESCERRLTVLSDDSLDDNLYRARLRQAALRRMSDDCETCRHG